MSVNNMSLIPSQWAYTDSWNPYVNYSNQSELIISNGYTMEIYGRGDAKTILQFYIPNEVVGSKISSAVLNMDMTFWWSSGQTIDSDRQTYIPIYYSSAITSGLVCDGITSFNYNSLITQGVRNTTKVWTNYLSYASNQIDITSIVTNNITNNILTVIIESPPGYQPRIISPNSISLGLTFESVDPVVPLITAPNGTYENRSKEIKFEWIYKSQTEATQASASLEYRQGTSGAYTGITVNSENNYYVMPANRLSAGIVEWRVCTTDTDGKTSDYAYGSFTVISAPAIPIVTSVDNKCISTVRWSSADQVAFEIEIYEENTLVFSNKVSSSDNNYVPNMFFKNSTYTIKLKVCNMYGLWSDWGSKTVVFSFSNPTEPSISVVQSNHDIVISTDTIGAILYKSNDENEFIPIYKFDNSKKYIDYKVASDRKYKYFIRKYESGYTDSKIATAEISIQGIILQNKTIYINTKISEETYMPFLDTLSLNSAKNFYSGREYAVIEFGEHKSRQIQRTCLVTEEQYRLLSELYFSATTIIYRDSKSNIMSCTIDGLQFKNAMFGKLSISITVSQIDESEEISIYD